MAFEVERYTRAACPDLDRLEEVAAAEGHSFVGRTRQEWKGRINCFDQPGEAFFVASAQGAIVGICGLNRDPYVDDRSVGRLRHLYVHPNHRRAGLATALVERCLSDASGTFRRVRLRTSNPAADTLYRSLGFEVVQESSATHVWWLQPPVSSGSTQGG